MSIETPCCCMARVTTAYCHRMAAAPSTSDGTLTCTRGTFHVHSAHGWWFVNEHGECLTGYFTGIHANARPAEHWSGNGIIMQDNHNGIQMVYLSVPGSHMLMTAVNTKTLTWITSRTKRGLVHVPGWMMG